MQPDITGGTLSGRVYVSCNQMDYTVLDVCTDKFSFFLDKAGSMWGMQHGNLLISDVRFT